MSGDNIKVYSFSSNKTNNSSRKATFRDTTQAEQQFELHTGKFSECYINFAGVTSSGGTNTYRAAISYTYENDSERHQLVKFNEIYTRGPYFTSFSIKLPSSDVGIDSIYISGTSSNGWLKFNIGVACYQEQ